MTVAANIKKVPMLAGLSRLSLYFGDTSSGLYDPVISDYSQVHLFLTRILVGGVFWAIVIEAQIHSRNYDPRSRNGSADDTKKRSGKLGLWRDNECIYFGISAAVLVC